MATWVSTYRTAIGTIDELVSPLSATERDAIMGRTAARVYVIGATPGGENAIRAGRWRLGSGQGSVQGGEFVVVQLQAGSSGHIGPEGPRLGFG